MKKGMGGKVKVPLKRRTTAGSSMEREKIKGMLNKVVLFTCCTVCQREKCPQSVRMRT